MATLDLGMTHSEFLRDYWQKKPLLIRKALSDFSSPLSPDELAGLALESDIESRIILENGASAWELKLGPFDESIFADLPEQDWTLLVQAVDHYIPAVADLKRLFKFIPDWRLDDVMISFAPKGGSVGAHYDNYDVFLIQGEGQREWSIGQWCTDDEALLCHEQLKILKEFKASDSWVLNPGDILYLPPKLAHLGIAVNDCTTYSIGFRAPSHNEIMADWCDEQLSQNSDEVRYQDSLTDSQSCAAQISATTVDEFKSIISKRLDDQNALESWLGQFLTQPKYPELWEEQLLPDEERYSPLELNEDYTDSHILIAPAARLNFIENEQELKVFINGDRYLLPLDQKSWLSEALERGYFDTDNTDYAEVQAKFICYLLNSGICYLEHE
jgi:50S ribosomal protein L16 3-hydroxylase